MDVNKKLVKLVHQRLVFPFVIASHTAYPSMVQHDVTVQRNFGNIWVSTKYAREHYCSTMVLLHVSNELDTSPTIFTTRRTILCWSFYYSLLHIITVISIVFNRPFSDLYESTAWMHDILEICLCHLHVHLHVYDVTIRWAQDTQMFLVTREKREMENISLLQRRKKKSFSQRCLKKKQTKKKNTNPFHMVITLVGWQRNHVTS